jgi:hypothetical protein
MTVDELTPYLGTPCNLRLRCRGCGGAHVLCGTPRAGKHVGDFVLRGYIFNVEDVEQVWRHDSPPLRGAGSIRSLLARSFAPHSSRARGANLP